MKELISVGVIVVLVGMFLILLSILDSTKGSSTKTKVAIGGLVGFIPFGWSNDKRLLWVSLAITAAMLIFWIFVQFRIGNS